MTVTGPRRGRTVPLWTGDAFRDVILWERAPGVGAWWATALDGAGGRTFLKIRHQHGGWALDERSTEVIHS